MRTCLRKIGMLAATLATAASVSLALLFTACPNNAGGNTGGGTPASVSYRITFRVDGGHGTLKATAEGIAETDKSPITVEKDKTVTFTAKPEAGYKVDKWTVTPAAALQEGGTAGNPTAKVKITANTKVNVSFTNDLYKVTLESLDSAKKDAVIKAVSEITGRSLEEAKTLVESAPQVFKEDVTAAEADEIIAIIAEAGGTASRPERYTVSLTPVEHGTVTANPVIPASGKVDKDTEITFTAASAEGYKVGTWTITPSPALQEGGTAGSTTAKVKITADTKVTVRFTLKTYPVNFTTPANGTLKAEIAGTPIASGNPVEYGKTVTFTAAPEPGHKVDKWTVTPASALQEGGTEGSLTAKVKITANTEVKVSFEELPPGSYTVKHYQEKAEGGYPAEPTENEILSGTPETNAQYTPKTYTGFTYKPARTKVNGIVQGTGAIAADNSTVVELYYERNTVNITFKLAGGNIGGNTNDVVRSGKYGAALTLPANPEKTGFVFKEWNPAPPSPLVFPSADTQYTADWAPLYTVTFSVDGTGGTLKAKTDGVAETAKSPISIEKDKTVTFTATPEPGYGVDKWTITGGALQEGGTSGSPTAKVKITATTTVSVSFKEAFTVAMMHGEHGTVSANPVIPPSYKVAEGTEITFTAAPEPGYNVDNWIITPSFARREGGTEGSTTAKVEIITNTYVNVRFTNKFRVSFRPVGTPANGRIYAMINGVGPLPSLNADLVEYGKTVTFTADPYSGYKVDKWTITGGTFEAGTGTPESPTAKVKITAHTYVTVSFKRAFTVAITPVEHGTLTANPVIPPGCKVDKDTEITFTAVPASSYKVDKWTITPASALQEGGTPGSTTAKVKITADTQVTVSFMQKEFPVTFSTWGDGVLKAEVDGTPITSGDSVDIGKTVTFTASPAAEYKVAWWQHNGGTFEEGGTPGSLTAKVKITANTKVLVHFTPLYDSVSFGTNGAALDNFLKTKATPHADGICYINLAYDINSSDLYSYNSDKPSALGKVLKNNPTKKVALKIPLNFATDMTMCFLGCTSLTQVSEIPSSLEKMRDCFKGCTSLTQVSEIPSSVTDMSYCFYDCTSLTQAPVIPSGVNEMSYCFEGCTSLTQAPMIPNSVTGMIYCFKGCTSLTHAPVIPSKVYHMNSCFEGCTSLTHAPVIPSMVRNMTSCFEGCTSLTQAPVIPSGVYDMTSCFKGCTSLTQAPVIPSSVTNMARCFSGCTSLTQAPVIPSKIYDMSYCFSGCSELTAVTLKCNYVKDKFDYAFLGCEKLTAGSIKVPAGQLQTYRNNAYKMYANSNWFIAE